MTVSLGDCVDPSCLPHTVEGLNYGYHNMLWGWIDTIKDNYPCTPP